MADKIEVIWIIQDILLNLTPVDVQYSGAGQQLGLDEEAATDFANEIEKYATIAGLLISGYVEEAGYEF